MYSIHHQDRPGQGRPTKADQRHVAFHNAAHATIALVVGVPFGRITLTGTNGDHLDPKLINRDIIAHFEEDDDAVWPYARRSVIVLLAGDIAECLVKARDATPIASDATRASAIIIKEFTHHFIGSVASLLRQEFPDNSLDCLQAFGTVQTFADNAFPTIIEAIKATFELVRGNWHCIERVAHELLAREHLSESEVEELIRGQTVASDEMTTEGGIHAN